ncbi:MAG TPA: hypothetical protein VNC50_10615, partial [Planctomycetia bacterium]|nr:hypothetical protein [Planctomycetia bacterium]
ERRLFNAWLRLPFDAPPGEPSLKIARSFVGAEAVRSVLEDSLRLHFGTAAAKPTSAAEIAANAILSAHLGGVRRLPEFPEIFATQTRVALASETPEVRRRCAAAIVHCGNDRALAAEILEKLLIDKVPEVALEALAALDPNKPERFTPGVQGRLRELTGPDHSRLMRGQAIEKLAAAPTITESDLAALAACAADSEEVVRTAGAAALQRIARRATKAAN